jgi:hypothetical protein
MCNQLANNGFEANGFKNVARIALGINATTIAIVAPFKTFKMNEPAVSFCVSDIKFYLLFKMNLYGIIIGITGKYL